MNENESLDLLLKLIETYRSNPDAAVEAAKLTVTGMVSVAAISLLGNLFATIYIVKSEARKTRDQLTMDRKNQLSISWHSEFKDLITMLLYETDPEIHADHSNKEEVVKLMHKLNLMLNESIPAHKKLNSLINKLALCKNGWIKTNETQLLKLQSSIIELSKRIVYQPNEEYKS